MVNLKNKYTFQSIIYTKHTTPAGEVSGEIPKQKHLANSQCLINSKVYHK